MRHVSWRTPWVWTLFASSIWPLRPSAAELLPASIPLAVRSPYMSAFLTNNDSSPPISQTLPAFWGIRQPLGWVGKIKVDGKTFSWMGGDEALNANVTKIQITPTRSIFVMRAGRMNITVTFLSPIEPSDWVLQSLPFSYVTVDLNTIDGNSHEVQLYSDINRAWATGDETGFCQFGQQATSNSVYHFVQSPGLKPADTEINGQAEDGTAYYAIAQSPGLTWRIDSDVAVRGQFRSTGTLANNASYLDSIQQRAVFAFAVNLGSVQSTSSPVTWTAGFVRNPSILYTAPPANTQQLHPYFVTKYGSDIGRAIDDLITGYSNALYRASTLDSSLLGNASLISPQYADLVAISARQTLASLDIAVPVDTEGNANTSEVRIFMNDIAVSTLPVPPVRRVSPVDRLYAAMPLFLYVNPSFLGSLLSPLLDAQDDLTGMAYSAQDLGLAYPVVSGTRGPHNSSVEQTGSMLIMLYAHARFSGDGSLLGQHASSFSTGLYNLAKRWADYLVRSTLTPDKEDYTYGLRANMSNLALKGIIGVKAMARISQALGMQLDAQNYNARADALMASWEALAISRDQSPHAVASYGDDPKNSWTLLYNAYADHLLGTGLVSQKLTRDQTSYYRALVNQFFDDDGDSRTSTAWTLFTAATVSDEDVRDSLIQQVWNAASFKGVGPPFSIEYDVSSDGLTSQIYSGGPAAGGLFSLLALHNVPGADTRSRSGKLAGAVVGGDLGGVAFLGVFACCVLLLRRRRSHSFYDDKDVALIAQEWEIPTPFFVTPRDTHNSPPQAAQSDADLAKPPPAQQAVSPNANIPSNEVALLPRIPSVTPVKRSPAPDHVVPSSPPPATPPPPGLGSSTPPDGQQPSAPVGRSLTDTRATGDLVVLHRTEVLGMQAEMENLREEMRQMLEDRLDEPLPEYTSTFGS
ncbi:hypothetical protein C8Q77DRAFT_1217900 [Trametes polyzona]|nr:hypothetical protein C8Q77DRAFT_1217900 [Trametes polyzona]